MWEVLSHGRIQRGVLRRLRASMRWLDRTAARRMGYPEDPDPRPSPEEIAKFTAFFRSLPVDDNARHYMEVHLRRLARTMTLVPKPSGSRRVLELGAYMQMTPALKAVCGYDEVRAADFGKLGTSAHKDVPLPEGQFSVDVDLFDAERDTFPYPGGYFSLVLCCEIIEHLLYDPMHMLLEIRRCLEPGGRLLLTTPNCASLSSIEAVLTGKKSPQIFAAYSLAKGEDRPHVREYTALEIGEVMKLAGFEVEHLVTERIVWRDDLRWVRELLLQNHFDCTLRGEQTYCLARMRPDLPVERHPKWLYE